MIPGLTWLSPAVAGIAAAIAVPSLVLLYFLKLRRQDVEISSTLLWRKAVQDLQANAPFQRLRKNILLLLQLLALAAILIALAQPQMEGERVASGRHAIVIDRGASMRTVDGINEDGNTTSRLEDAKRRALAFVETLREPSVFGVSEADRAMVVAFDSTAEVVQPFTTDKRLLRAAIESIEPSDAASRLDEPLRLVRAQAPLVAPTDEAGAEAGEPRPGAVGTIHIFSDGRPEGGEAVDLHAEDEIEFVSLGQQETGNVGITALDARRQLRQPEDVSVIVGLQSTEREQKAVAVELLIDGTSVAARRLALPAATIQQRSTEDGQTEEVIAPATSGVEFQVTRPGSAIIEARVQDASTGGAPDAFDRDDRAWVVLPGAKRLRLALVTTGSLVLSEALSALPVERVEVFTPDTFQSIEDPFARFDVVVLDGWLPEVDQDTESGREFGLPRGSWLVIDAVPTGPSGLTDNGDGPPAEIVDWRRDHPTLRGLSLSAIRLAASRQIEASETGSATVIASTGGGPAIVAIESARTRAVVVPWDIDESNWWLEPSFIVFLGQSVRHVTDGGPGDARVASRPGVSRGETLPIGVDDARLTPPEGDPLNVPVDSAGQAVAGPLDEVGLYTLSWDGLPGPNDTTRGIRSERTFAVNLTSADASDVTPKRDLVIRAARVGASSIGDGSSRTPRSLWPCLIVVGLAVIMLEWYVYNRKVQL
ncbi:MAG: VWA domain-containing protein [Phycisphaerales bacterium]